MTDPDRYTSLLARITDSPEYKAEILTFNFRDQVAVRMQDLRISSDDLGLLVGDPDFVRRLLDDEVQPSILQMCKLAKALKATLRIAFVIEEGETP